MKYSVEEETLIMKDIWSEYLYFRPLEFIKYVFPWGKEGTFLEKIKGPRKWQEEELLYLQNHLIRNQMLDECEIYKFALASGRGIGKTVYSVLVSLFLLCTRIGISVIATANTEEQLRTVFWAELDKWATSMVCSHWFKTGDLRLYPAPWLDSLIRTQMNKSTKRWMIEGKTWSKDNPDAFAGPHNTEGMAIVFEEASGIIDPIYSITEGYFTEKNPNRFFIAVSNPRRSTGAFFTIFDKNLSSYRKRQIDGRSVEDTDENVYRDIIEKYGEDSYEAKVEVKGEFPNSEDDTFISRNLIKDAMERKAQDVIQPSGLKVILGIDWSGQGKDKTSVQARRGYVHIASEVTTSSNQDEIVAFVVRCIEEIRPNIIYGDDGGLGWVYNGILASMGYNVIRVNNSWKSSNKVRWANKRAELWDKMRIWYKKASVIKNNERLERLCQIKIKENAPLQLMTKAEMKKKGILSPDEDDALSLTFMSNEIELLEDVKKELTIKKRTNRLVTMTKSNSWMAY